MLQLIVHYHIDTQLGSVINNSRYAFVDKSTGECVVPQQLGHNEQHQAVNPLLANLYVCKGEPGTVIKVCAKKRTGKLDFIASMQKALENHYKDELVGKFVLNCLLCLSELYYKVNYNIKIQDYS